MAGQEVRLVDGAEQGSDGYLALAIHLDGYDVLVGRLELQPGAAVGDQLGVAEVAAAGVVSLQGEVDARGADQLGDDDTLGAVDDEGALVRHEREVAHEYLLLFDLAGLLDEELDDDPQGGGVGGVPLPALLLRVLGLPEAVIGETHLQAVACEVLDGRELVQAFPQPFGPERLVGVQLDADEVGYSDGVWDARVGLAEQGDSELALDGIAGHNHA